MREDFESITRELADEMREADDRIVTEFADDSLESYDIMTLLCKLSDALYLQDEIDATDEIINSLKERFYLLVAEMERRGFLITDYYSDLLSKTAVRVIADKLIRLRQERTT